MREIAGKEIGKLGERFKEGVPGFALVVLVLGILLPLTLPDGSERSTAPGEALRTFKQLLPVLVLALAWAGDFFGHYLDDWMFNPVWGVPGCQKMPEVLKKILLLNRLNESRTKLAEHWEQPVSGIFAKAQQLAGKTELWEKKIKWPLEFSKACRSLLIISLVGLLMWLGWTGIIVIFVFSFVWLLIPTEKPWTGFKSSLFGISVISLVLMLIVQAPWNGNPARFAWPSLLVVASAICTTGYLWLRIRHIRALYEEARNIQWYERNGFFCAGQKIMPIRSVLLRADLSVTDRQLQQAEDFIKSEALLHVRLKTAHGMPLPRCRDRAELRLEQVKAVQGGSESRCPRFDPSHPCDFDFVIDLVPPSLSGADPNEPANLARRLNGIL